MQNFNPIRGEEGLNEGPAERRAHRLALIRFHVWREGPVSRARIGQILSLNLPTVSNCVGELLEQCEIIEEGYAESTGGRKPQLLSVNPRKGSVVGITFSSRGISSAWADLRGTLNNVRIYPFSPAMGKERTLDTLRQAVQEQLQAVRLAPEAGPVKQIGIGISGLVDAREGVSLGFPRFDEWVDVPLRSIFERDFQIPTVVDNHIVAVTLAESIVGQLKDFENALYVQLGPGLGIGILINGRIYRGSKLNVGEFGHTTVTENGPICYCGNYGCLESLASDYALAQQTEAALREGVKTTIPEYAPEPGKITTGAIFRAAADGDRFALNLVEKAARLLGTGIANLVNLFGPQMIIIGGTMAEAGGDMLMSALCGTLSTKALDRMEKDVEIRRSSFGNEEAIRGAVTLALYHYFTAPLITEPGASAGLLDLRGLC
ncbi:MAG: ROK family protein [Candidatus Sumerlaeaceae bacterium]|nr:ROK family protein [Candidatus Sumerlaeaceae bacterium]